LDEVLIWVDRNQLGRRNLTDSQRAEVIGRIYNTLKQNPILNLKQFQSKDNGKDIEDRTANFAVRKGSDATAKAVAEATGVSVRTVHNAGKFAEAVAALERISPKAAERVLRGEVRDAKTELPKVPKEAFSFVANSQTPPLFRGRVGGM
jgi:DNA-directed RNA polymerase specialized sigma subunit